MAHLALRSGPATAAGFYVLFAPHARASAGLPDCFPDLSADAAPDLRLCLGEYRTRSFRPGCGTRNTRALYGVGAGTVQRFLAVEASAMGWSMDRQGIRTLFDHESKRLKQVELSGPRRERVVSTPTQTNSLPARSNSVRVPNTASGPNQDHCAEHSPGFGIVFLIPFSRSRRFWATRLKAYCPKSLAAQLREMRI